MDNKMYKNNNNISSFNDEILSEIVYNKIVIKTEFIRLDQFLKLSNIASSGGEAKLIILDGLIYINDEICLLRGKKLYPNDKVLFLSKGEFESGKEEFLGFIIDELESLER